MTCTWLVLFICKCGLFAADVHSLHNCARGKRIYSCQSVPIFLSCLPSPSTSPLFCQSLFCRSFFFFHFQFYSPPPLKPSTTTVLLCFFVVVLKLSGSSHQCLSLSTLTTETNHHWGSVRSSPLNVSQPCQLLFYRIRYTVNHSY